MNIHTGARLFHNQSNPTSSGVATVLGTDQRVRFGITVLSLSTNTQTIYVGNSGVTSSNGFPLAAGAAIDLPVDNVNKIYTIGSGTIAWIGA